ncbi:transposase [uncultured Bifidobacterium sp.]|uniref:transposase n=1 Tax=Bifidobacterium thermophilum TaxID=33905 RepID=UPI00258C1429|nr:transposase [uncultured Bifidobacterium sp.]
MSEEHRRSREDQGPGHRDRRCRSPGHRRGAIQEWRGRAWRSRIPEFVELQKKIARHLDAIVATAENGLTNARVESVNNKIKVIVRIAYGFRSLDNLFAMVMLRCSRLEVPLPGRS